MNTVKMLVDKGPIEHLESEDRIQSYLQSSSELIEILQTNELPQTKYENNDDIFPLEKTTELLNAYYLQLLNDSKDISPKIESLNADIVIRKWEKCTIKIDQVPCTIFLNENGGLEFEYAQHIVKLQKALIGKTSLKVFMWNALRFCLDAETKAQLDKLEEIKEEGISINNIHSVSINQHTLSFVYRHLSKPNKQGYQETTDYAIPLSITQLREILVKTNEVRPYAVHQIELYVDDYPEVVNYFKSLSEKDFAQEFKDFIENDLVSVKLELSKKPISLATSKS